MKVLICLLMTLVCNCSYAETVTIHKVILLTKRTEPANHIMLAQTTTDKIGAYFDSFIIDDAKYIQDVIEKSIPSDLKNKSQTDIEAYMQSTVLPKFNAQMGPLMKSKFGLGMAKLYHVDRIPAIVINDKYVYYGDNVSKAIKLISKRETK